MTARLHLLTFFLLAGFLSARGQDLRTGVPLSDGRFLAAGECLAWVDAEGNVLRLKTLDKPLTALAADENHFYALDHDGRELIELDSEGHAVSHERLPVKGRLRALSCERNILWAVTDAGEIVQGNKATGWTVLDFNRQYDGYYPQMDFRAIAAGGGSIMVAGIRPDGTPAAFTSSRGTVWSERMLDYTELGQPCTFAVVPTSLSYDSRQDRFFLLGSGGQALALPGCSHCNSLSRYPADTLYARIPSGTGALLLGNDGFRKSIQ